MSSAVTHPINPACLILPYGYQIDLDFIKYCENLTQPDPSEAELQRRQKRRQRQSMEVMLGIQMEMQNQMDQLGEFWNKQPPEPPPRTHSHTVSPAQRSHYKRQQFTRQPECVSEWDSSLNEVVDDFEKTLQRSGRKQQPLPGENENETMSQNLRNLSRLLTINFRQPSGFKNSPRISFLR